MFLILFLFIFHGGTGYNLDMDNLAILKINDTHYQGNPQDVNNSYFGFSLAGYKHDNKIWLLVGAPKATPSYSYRQKPRDVESGGLFSCDVNSMTSYHQQILCTEVIADDLKKESSRRIRSHQFLGGSLTTPKRGEGIIVICGHRGKFDIPSRQDRIMMGGCRQIFNLSTPGELLTDSWYEANSSLGVSVEYVKDGSGVDIGDPRYNNGTAVAYRLEIGVFKQVQTYNRPQYSGDTYGGYDVTSGDFQGSGLLLRVMGAPKWNNKGNVYLFSSNNKMVADILPNETQTGSYFGAKVCACDIDNDDKDELLVGAPLYKTNTIEEGRVYVFTLADMSRISLKTRVSGTVARGRFGAMITCAGDLDNDGFKDVLIGAPYEPQGGAVYVYNGGKTGLADSPSQKLTPPSGQNLSSFGHSGTVIKNIMKDRDSSEILQQMKGVAVGAFQSNVVIMYKTRPVIFLKPRFELPRTISVMVDTLMQEKTHIYLSAVNISLIYSKAQMNEINISMSVLTDTLAVHTNLSKRVWYRDVTLHRGRPTRLQIPLYLTDPLLPFPYDFEVMLKYKLRRRPSLGSLEPVLYRLGSTDLKAKSTIDLKCGDSQQCVTVISLYGAKYEGPEGTSLIVYKDTRTSTFEVGVRNGDHVARGVELNVALPEETRYQSATISGNFTEVSCMRAGIEVKCTFSHFTPANVDTRFRFSLSLHEVPPIRDVTFNVSVTTLTSEAERTENNNIPLNVPLSLKVDIDVVGHTTPSEIAVRLSGAESEKYVSYDVTVVNQGPGALPNVTWYLCITVPVTKNLIQTLNKSHFGQCTLVINDLKISSKASSSELCSSGQKVESLVYSCSAAELGIESVHKATFKLKINSEVAKTLLGSSHDLHINFTIFVLGPENLDLNTDLIVYKKKQSQLRLVGWNDSETGLNLLWVILGSTVGGGLFMAVTVLVLYKAGFFKRQKKEEMERMFRATVIRGCDEDGDENT